MAIKGQKFKKYSSKLKEQILREYFDEGKSPSYLSSKIWYFKVHNYWLKLEN